jgi:hypothetical protein
MSEQSRVLAQGLETLSNHYYVTFTRYVKQILPLDGFIFWVRASLLDGQVAPFTVSYPGSLHVGINAEMRVDQAISVNQVIFTSPVEIVTDFNTEGGDTLWIGDFEGIRGAFNMQGNYYKEANLYHYTGDAIYPIMSTQIIDDLGDLDLENAVVSNSAPLWIGLNQLISVYNAYLLPPNLKPPYAVINIKDTQALTITPWRDNRSSRYQLTKDTIEVTLFGARNNMALDFIQYVQDYALNTESIGIMNAPIAKDLQLPQSEINAMAMAKKIDFEINYYQTRIDDLDRKLILSAFAEVCADVGRFSASTWDSGDSIWDGGASTWDYINLEVCNH